MSSSSGGYGTPPFPPFGPSPPATGQAPPREFDADTGTFSVALTTPPWAERGATSRFKFSAVHVIDGLITAYTTGPTIGVLDKNGLAVPATYITASAAAADPTANGSFVSDVQILTIAPEGDYIVEWTATYTPKAGGPALPLRNRRAFRVQATKARSQYYFTPTDQA